RISLARAAVSLVSMASSSISGFDPSPGKTGFRHEGHQVVPRPGIRSGINTAERVRQFRHLRVLCVLRG
ncbi:MAG: hypothetical protein WBM59_17155, partial [Sedimenticolaceae bacterium]